MTNRMENKIMKIADVKELKIEETSGSFPFHVEIVGNSHSVFGAGQTLTKALMRAFSVSGMFPNEQFPFYTEKELARFLFWGFNGSNNWAIAIEALSND